MKAVITVVGKDTLGIVANISTYCSECNVNVQDVTQSLMQDLFAMIMIVDITALSIPFAEFAENLEKIGNKMGLSVHTMHEDIFNSMHRI